MAKPQVKLSLEWTGGLAFRADAPGGRHLVADGNSTEGLSPVEMLAVATASCMAADVVHILTKVRQPPAAVRIDFTGDRAAVDPHRFTRMHIAVLVEGDIARPQLDRAIRLSRDKYCSVWNTIREDTVLEITTSIQPARPH
jgi:putative redox protein